MPRLTPCLVFLALSSATFAATFPKPNPDKTFADQKVFDAAGRPWRAAQEDWAGAKQRVATDPAWTAWLTRERASVDAWIAKHHDHVEWAGGWSHDGVSPVDGSELIWTEKIPREEAQTIKSRAGDDVQITDLIFAWWVVEFRGRHVDTMSRAASLYRLTGDERYAAWVAGQMDFYANNLATWKTLPTAKNSPLFWQTLTEASNLVKFTNAVRLLGDYVAKDRLAQWREKFFAPEVKHLNATFQNIHNIATWQRCAVAQVALLFHDEAMWRDALDSKFGLRAQMDQGITSDYLWYEQSLGYNNFVVQAVCTLFKAAGVAGRAAELAPEMMTAENLMLSPLYLRFPNGQLPNPADNKGIPTAPNRDVYASVYRVFPTVIGLEAIAGRRDWETLLDPPPAPPHASSLPAITSRNFESTRMALLKSGGWQVFFHYGQLTRSHVEAEALNYSAFYGDTDITHDPGVVGYGSPLYKGYYQRGLNHNVPLVSGEGQEPPKSGELLAYSESPASVAAAQPDYRKDSRARRSLAIDGNNFVDTATIESRDGQPLKLGLALHVQGKVKLADTFGADKAFAAGRPEPFKYWRNVSGANFHDRAEFDVDYGKGVIVHVTLTAPGDFKLWHGSSPDVPPKRRDSFYLELAAPAASATFTTTFAPTAKP